jgi:hypothetical protein
MTDLRLRAAQRCVIHPTMKRSPKFASCDSVSSLALAFAFGLSVFGAGCSSSSGRPVLASSASQPSYAVRYADGIAGATKAIADRKAEEQTLTTGFAAHVDELKKPDWDKVLLIVERADEAGKSASFAEAHSESTAARTFWTEEQTTISSKVGGNAQYAAKQANCTADVSGAATFALKDAVDKQLEKRLRSKNDAFVVIERYGTSLGKENTAVLEKLADEVAQASYIVHVDLPDQKERLKTRLAERSTVATTLDRVIQEEKAFQAEAGRTDAEKKASEERVNIAAKSRSDLDRAAAEGDEALKTVDQRIEAATKEYDAALKALKEKIAEKKKSA